MTPEELAAERPEPSRPMAWAPAFGLACAIWAFYLVLTPWTTLWDRDEALYARAAVEMLQSGRYLYPTFADRVFAIKPILIYWLMSLSMRFMGPTELAARFWAPIGMAIAAYLTYLVGCRLGSRRVGLWAMVIVAFNPLAMMQALAATIDAVLLALTTGAVAAFVWRMTSDRRCAPAIAFAIATAGGLLAKGPMALLPLLVVGGVIWTLRARVEARRMIAEFALAALAAAVVFGLWWFPANAATGGLFYTQGVQDEIVRKLFVPQQGHGGNPIMWLPFYPLVVVIGFAPWSAYVPAAVHRLWRTGTVDEPARAVLLWWMFVPLALFSAAATHLQHYILPTWPAFALAAASMLDRKPSKSGAAERWIRLTPSVVAVTTAAAASVTLVALPVWAGVPGLGWRSVPVVAAIVLGTAFFVRYHRGGARDRALWAAISGVIAFEVLIGAWWLPAAERAKPVPRIAEAVRARTSKGERVATYGFSEPSLNFYLGRSPVQISSVAELEDWVREPGSGCLITTRAVLAAANSVLPLDEIAAWGGFNVANGKRIELVALATRAGAADANSGSGKRHPVPAPRPATR